MPAPDRDGLQDAKHHVACLEQVAAYVRLERDPSTSLNSSHIRLGRQWSRTQHRLVQITEFDEHLIKT